MSKSNLQTKRALRTVLFVLLSVVGMTNSFAYDFAAVAENGQTLYYSITNTSTQTVKVTHPSSDIRWPYNGFTKPTGDLIIPYYVEYNGIGYSVTAIDDYAFGTYYSIDGIFDIYSCSGLTSVTIPSSVLTIGQRAFQNCTGITTVNIPTSVTNISSDVFRNCNSLVTVNFNATNCQSVGENIWAECMNFTTLNLGNTVTRIPTHGFQGAAKLTSVILPNSLTTIGNYGFEGCTALTTVTCDDASALATVGDYSFKNCSNLTNINLPNTLTTIGNYAFTGCRKLESTSATQLLPNALTSIGDYAFQNAITLAYIRIPTTLISLGKYAFQGCTALNTVVYEAAECAYSGTQSEPPFYGCSALVTVQVSSDVTQIPTYCFKDCTALTLLKFCDGLTTIGTYAFYACQNINNLIIPASVDSIGSFAFSNSYDLQLNQLWSLNTTPPTISAEAVFPAGQTVYVPSASVDAYQNDDNWSNYNIVGRDLSGECEIEALANFEWRGTVSGAGSFEMGSICTLTAVANEGCSFVNWMKGGTVVSNSETYSFIVTEDASLVANFGLRSYEITASANPAEAGVITGAGSYDFGENVTLVASPTEGYHFVNWTEGGVEVSTEASYSFTVSDNRSLMAHFSELVNHWEPEISEYEDNMTITCVLQLNEVEQHSVMYEVGAFCGTECRGSQRATYFPPTERYIIQMTVSGEVNDVISFRLYDHYQDAESVLTPPEPVTFTSNGYGSLYNPYVLNFTNSVLISAEATPADAGTITGTGNYMVGTEATLTANANLGYQFFNWTLNGEVVSTSSSYQFTVTNGAHYVANFKHVHTQMLNNGWNWWSTYVESSNNDGLNQLENSIGSAGVVIKSRANGYVEAYEYNGETNWYGTLNSINSEQMYKICTNAACNATVAGALAMPANHPITINNGWNWIGFLCNQNVSVDVAMSDFTPENNDVIKGRNGFTTYYSDDNYSMWYGSLTTLEVGKGYMYRSNSTAQKTLVYQAGRGETTVENVTTENNVFQPAGGKFADNMTLTAVLELDGEELRSDDYELAAFVGDECRGSVKLIYVEPVNRYVAFLTIFGEPSETLYFRLTDGTQTELSMDEISFVADGMEGSLAEPMTLRFGMTQVDENELSKVLVYPNPSNGVFHIQGQGIRKVEVFNAFGQAVVLEETSNDDLQIDLSRYANGFYMLRVVTENGITNSQLIKK